MFKSKSTMISLSFLACLFGGPRQIFYYKPYKVKTLCTGEMVVKRTEILDAHHEAYSNAKKTKTLNTSLQK